MSMADTASRATRRPQEKRQPKYHAMAKVNGGWVRIGAAWSVRSGDDALSVQLTSQPMNWDGRFSLFVPNLDPPTDGD